VDITLSYTLGLNHLFNSKVPNNVYGIYGYDMIHEQ